MRTKEENGIYYLCSLIEYIARETKNKRCYIVKQIGKPGLEHLLEYADVNHCLSFEQVSDETVSEFSITDGQYDTVGNCLYKVPSFLAIGKVYQRLISDTKLKQVSYVDNLIMVYSSWIADEIADFNTNAFYSSREYLKASYEAGEFLID